MGQIVAIVVLIVFLSMLFFSTSLLLDYRFQTMDTKQNMSLSAKALAKAVEEVPENLDGLSLGYNQDQLQLTVDHELLLNTFDEILYANYYDQPEFETIQEHILIKVLVYYDRFFITDQLNRWSEPYFFTYPYEGNLYYLTTYGEDLYTYLPTGERVPVDLSSVDLTLEDKETIILDKINYLVGVETQKRNEGIPLKIEINHSGVTDLDYQHQYGHFNVLEGITFFVVYGEHDVIGTLQQSIHYNQYNVVGYTVYPE